LLEFLAAVTRGQNAAVLFAEDGAAELPFLHSLRPGPSCPAASRICPIRRK
jgi:hypothetical protein